MLEDLKRHIKKNHSGGGTHPRGGSSVKRVFNCMFYVLISAFNGIFRLFIAFLCVWGKKGPITLEGGTPYKVSPRSKMLHPLLFTTSEGGGTLPHDSF